MASTIRSTGHRALYRELVNARVRAGITQTELAERVQCQQSLIARIESGQRRIDAVELVVLARALNIEPQILLDVISEAMSSDALKLGR